MMDAVEVPQAVTVARANSTAGEVVLRRRDEGRARVIELIVNGVFVMDTVDTTTERGLAELALGRHDDPRRVLVGGLGLGFTADAVLSDERPDLVVVVEIAEPLIDWARDGLLPMRRTTDPRLELRAGDIADTVARTPGEWSVVLLDVDNGPGFLVRDENIGLYAGEGLASVAAALARGGLLAIWSSHRSPELADALRELGGEVDIIERAVRRRGRDLGYAIHLFRRHE